MKAKSSLGQGFALLALGTAMDVKSGGRMFANNLKKVSMHLTFALVASALVGCGQKMSFEGGKNYDSSTQGTDQDQGSQGTGSGALKTMSESYVQGSSSGKVDILVVVDNSGSMSEDQQKLGAKLANFIAPLAQVDWQISVTTTDVDGNSSSTDGEVMSFMGSNLTVVDKYTPMVEDLFLKTVAQDQWKNCNATMSCGSGNEQPLRAMQLAFEKSRSMNKDLFRQDADTAVLVISDEDEKSDGSNAPTEPSAVLDTFKSEFGPNKKLSVYGIIVEPGDTGCLGQQGSGAHYGQKVADLSKMSGGSTYSICLDNYGPMLDSIAKSVKNMVNSSFQLAEVPDNGQVVVTLIPEDPKVKTSVVGNKVYFSPVPQEGTLVKIDYQYRE